MSERFVNGAALLVEAFGQDARLKAAPTITIQFASNEDYDRFQGLLREVYQSKGVKPPTTEIGNARLFGTLFLFIRPLKA